MKIAFDVQGTLIGRNSAKVISLFKILQARGHECHVWSFGGYGMAADAAKSCGIQPTSCMSKRIKEHGEDSMFDICVDDDAVSASMLDAERVIHVKDIPDEDASDRFSKFMELF